MTVIPIGLRAGGASARTLQLLAGDCRQSLAALAAAGEQFDAIVTDPPYHLTAAKGGAQGFMGKAWDGGDIAFQAEFWRLAFAVLKPGGHLAAFGASRTSHRMVVAIEDAGFEVRDSLMWVYGTGFPKSQNVSKAIDKAAKRKGRVIAVGAPVARMIPGADQDRTGSWVKDSGRTYQPGEYVPATAEAAEWQGWGTALKPAFEPIILARKPLVGTVAANVLEHGTGAINIDASRIEAHDGDRPRPPRTANEILGGGKGTDLTASPHNELGRWPANVLHDGSDEVLDAFAAFGEKGGGSPTRRASRREGSGWERPCDKTHEAQMQFYADTGTAARFFYSAKASKADRAGSKHPTVKPVALMRWLCTLITPPGGRILDPFAGSGTTLQAAYEAGFSATGCEREAEYQADIRRRIAATLRPRRTERAA